MIERIGRREAGYFPVLAIKKPGQAGLFVGR
jgi:hypothetical protein